MFGVLVSPRKPTPRWPHDPRWLGVIGDHPARDRSRSASSRVVGSSDMQDACSISNPSEGTFGDTSPTRCTASGTGHQTAAAIAFAGSATADLRPDRHRLRWRGSSVGIFSHADGRHGDVQTGLRHRGPFGRASSLRGCIAASSIMVGASTPAATRPPAPISASSSRCSRRRSFVAHAFWAPSICSWCGGSISLAIGLGCALQAPDRTDRHQRCIGALRGHRLDHRVLPVGLLRRFDDPQKDSHQSLRSCWSAPPSSRPTCTTGATRA